MADRKTINRLNTDIALFMGRELTETSYAHFKKFYPDERWFVLGKDVHCLASMRYNDSWDWIMKVVAKLKEECKKVGQTNDYFIAPLNWIMQDIMNCDLPSAHAHASDLCRKFNEHNKTTKK